jgi:hypothetical protein
LATAPPPPQPEARPRPSYHVGAILITLAGGILLAAGSCFGFLGTLNMNGVGESRPLLNPAFAIGFFVGVLGAIAGGIWALAAIITFLIHAASDEV